MQTATVEETASEFLTSDEVIDRLLLQPTLRRHATTCVLPAVRVGSEWLFRKIDLERWIAQRTSS